MLMTAVDVHVGLGFPPAVSTRYTSLSPRDTYGAGLAMSCSQATAVLPEGLVGAVGGAATLVFFAAWMVLVALSRMKVGVPSKRKKCLPSRGSDLNCEGSTKQPDLSGGVATARPGIVCNCAMLLDAMLVASYKLATAPIETGAAPTAEQL